MALRGTDPELYITEYTVVYEDKGSCVSIPASVQVGVSTVRQPQVQDHAPLNRFKIVGFQKVFTTSFCKCQFPHKFVNLSFIITNINNKLTDLCGNYLLENDLINAFCEMI